MERIDIRAAQKLTAPNPFCLLSSQKPDGTTNLMALSWWTYVSNQPPTLAVCLSNKGFSGTCIRETGQFGLSLVGKNLREQAIKVGTCSGRTVDKAAELGIPLRKLDGFGPMLVSDSRVCFACRVSGSHAVGDHTLFLGEVVQILGNPAVGALYACDGYRALCTVFAD